MSFSFQAFTKITETTGAIFQKEKKEKNICYEKAVSSSLLYLFFKVQLLKKLHMCLVKLTTQTFGIFLT